MVLLKTRTILIFMTPQKVQYSSETMNSHSGHFKSHLLRKIVLICLFYNNIENLLSNEECTVQNLAHIRYTELC